MCTNAQLENLRWLKRKIKSWSKKSKNRISKPSNKTINSILSLCEENTELIGRLAIRVLYFKQRQDKIEERLNILENILHDKKYESADKETN